MAYSRGMAEARELRLRFSSIASLGELEDTVVGHVHRWPIVRDRSANLFGFPVEHGLNDHPALPRPRGCGKRGLAVFC
jgi:hypothetical protein